MGIGGRVRRKALLLFILLCGFVTVSCNKTAADTPALTAKAGKKSAAAEKNVKPPAEKASVTTPPLDLTQTSDTSAPATSDKTPPAQTANAQATPTNAAAPVGEVVPFSPTQVKGKTNVVLLLDGSGSMNAPIESGTKIEYLRSLVKDLLVQPAPGTMKRSFAIRAFGTTAAVEQNNCEDSAALAALDQINAATIAAQLDGLTPRGTSPIAYALQQAAAMLPDAGPDADNMIIVLADGGDTCNADPCLAAQQLHDGPKKVLISVIGFDLDQAAEQQLRCIAEHADGRFFLARNVPELRTAGDQALNANLPYNLRIKTFAGTVPLNTKITVYRGGTQQVIEDGFAPGVKFFQLQPGTYDIQITYAESPETTKPAKLLKGVEVQSTARAEQEIRFDFGVLQLTGVAPDGSPVGLRYTLRSATNEPAAVIQGAPGDTTAYLRPGTYSIEANGPTINGVPLAGRAEKITVIAGQSISQQFAFETGTMFLRAQTSHGVFIPAAYQIAAVDHPETPLTSGTIGPEGTAIPLPVGTYRVVVTAEDPLVAAGTVLTFDQLAVPAREQIQQLATFPVGILQLAGRDVSGAPVATRFEIRTNGAALTDPPLTSVDSGGPAVSLDLKPGKYAVLATSLGSNVKPAPSIIWDQIDIAADATVSRDAQFQLGSITVTGVDARNAALPVEYTIFHAGDDTPLYTRSTENGVTSFQLTPGLYDIRAQDTSSRSAVRPTLWLRSIPIAAAGSTDRSLVFTAGRIRITCRAANDVPIGCVFRVFTYGQDAPLVAGDTKEQWQEFEIKPGYYYLEVAYFDPSDDQVLKKWINISVAENETVEEIVRF